MLFMVRVLLVSTLQFAAQKITPAWSTPLKAIAAMLRCLSIIKGDSGDWLTP